MYLFETIDLLPSTRTFFHSKTTKPHCIWFIFYTVLFDPLGYYYCLATFNRKISVTRRNQLIGSSEAGNWPALHYYLARSNNRATNLLKRMHYYVVGSWRNRPEAKPIEPSCIV